MTVPRPKIWTYRWVYFIPRAAFHFLVTYCCLDLIKILIDFVFSSFRNICHLFYVLICWLHCFKYNFKEFLWLTFPYTISFLTISTTLLFIIRLILQQTTWLLTLASFLVIAWYSLVLALWMSFLFCIHLLLLLYYNY